MKEIKIFDTTDSNELENLVNDLCEYYNVTDIKYSTYIKPTEKATEYGMGYKEQEVHYTVCATYINHNSKLED